jgi:hypothetical protein
VSDVPQQDRHDDDVLADLVEYLIVAVPDLASLGVLVPALATMAASGTIRILDVVVVTRLADGSLEVLEPDAVQSLEVLTQVEGHVGGLLTEHDIAMAAVALRPASAGIILVTEDRWAEPLSVAARRAGGQILAGERIPPSHVRMALLDVTDDAKGA